MPANPRVRTNNVQGTVSDNPLTNVATTLNSSGLANLAAISSQHAVIILDPLRSAGAPEIVVVTAHTGAATSATVSRGQYGTSARQHAQGTLWVHAPLTEDFLAIVTSSTRPSDPYRGQVVFETDTDKLMARSIADAWQEVVDLGAWDSWTPTWTNVTVGNGTVVAKFSRSGRTIRFRLRFTLGSTSAVGTTPIFTLPATAAADYALEWPLGPGGLIHNGVKSWIGCVQFWSTTQAVLVRDDGAGAYGGISATSPFTWGTGDYFFVTGTYEAAA